MRRLSIICDMAHLRTLVMLLVLIALAIPAQAKKDKTKGLPAARNNNVPDVDARTTRHDTHSSIFFLTGRFSDDLLS